MKKQISTYLFLLLPGAACAGSISQNSVLLTVGMIALIPFLIPFFTILLINGLKKLWKQKLSTIRKRYIIYSGWIGALIVIIVFAIYGETDFPWYILYGSSIPFSLAGYLIAILKNVQDEDKQ